MPTSSADMSNGHDQTATSDEHEAAHGHETEAARIGRTEHGAYIVAPDSADPWPSDIWDRVDLQVAEEEYARVTKADINREPEALVAVSGFVFSRAERELLAEIDQAAFDSLDD